eukprot:TRINITY_DN6684_c0_g1_i1.p1 TRINITY_DN6684_c0_g1~~TRINITY_DN6684_c0_g1_i1.p1  ORF type:complete len:452 (-),score=76.24 TRINITY_DN6684_c0_g1_i1:299-1654(-)
MSTVQAYIYDISQGMASQMSMALIGKQIDLIPHTGIVVFGKEYFFGSGPCVGMPGNTIGVATERIIELGETGKTCEELDAYIRETLALEHTQENYNLCTHNCNHYANDIVRFLLDGKELPSNITNAADDALSTPQGQSLREMIEVMETKMRGNMGGNSALNPFGHVGGDTMPFAAEPQLTSSAGPRSLEIPSIVDGLDGAIAQLLSNPSREVVKIAMQTLLGVAENIIHKPKEDKFRRLKKSNVAVHRKLTGVPGGASCLLALGFTESHFEGEQVWCAPVGRDGLDRLVDGKARIASEYDRLLDTPIDEVRQKKNSGPGGIMGMIENALQDPLALKRLLSNPMVAQMARANPEAVEEALQSPAVQTAVREHPEMRSQIEQLIGRPIAGLVNGPPVATQGVAVGATASVGNDAFEVQLRQLAEMGFCDRAACVAALERARGDLELALAELVG